MKQTYHQEPQEPKHNRKISQQNEKKDEMKKKLTTVRKKDYLKTLSLIVNLKQPIKS